MSEVTFNYDGIHTYGVFVDDKEVGFISPTKGTCLFVAYSYDFSANQLTAIAEELTALNTQSPTAKE